MKRSDKRKRFKAQRQHSIEGSSGGGSKAHKTAKVAGATKEGLKARWMYDPKTRRRRMLRAQRRADP